uniref:G_PROTEIN_RECEP_F1_2 domain-containing protein n=1 Tax=Panagrellus redivivus TaxID=6233 RepID=A0A7E4VAM6_PANRE
MVASGVMTLAQLTVEAKDGIVFLGSGNPCFPLQGQWRCSPVMIFGIVNNVGFWSVPIQAMFRYIIIVKKRQISPWFPLIVYATVGLFISSVTFPAAFLATTNSPTLPKLQSMEFWKTEDIHELCTIDIVAFLAGFHVLSWHGDPRRHWNSFTFMVYKSPQQNPLQCPDAFQFKNETSP